MKLFTIGFTQKSAEEFFGLIKANNIELVLDVRLWNSTQLAGFSKGGDLKYFLKAICDCDYLHAVEYSPTKELFKGKKDGSISWSEYEAEYRRVIGQRGSLEMFEAFYNINNICLLCAEPTPDTCHRGLLAEMLTERYDGITVIHL